MLPVKARWFFGRLLDSDDRLQRPRNGSLPRKTPDAPTGDERVRGRHGTGSQARNPHHRILTITARSLPPPHQAPYRRRRPSQRTVLQGPALIFQKPATCFSTTAIGRPTSSAKPKRAFSGLNRNALSRGSTSTCRGPSTSIRHNWSASKLSASWVGVAQSSPASAAPQLIPAWRHAVWATGSASRSWMVKSLKVEPPLMDPW